MFRRFNTTKNIKNSETSIKTFFESIREMTDYHKNTHFRLNLKNEENNNNPNTFFQENTPEINEVDGAIKDLELQRRQIPESEWRSLKISKNHADVAYFGRSKQKGLPLFSAIFSKPIDVSEFNQNTNKREIHKANYAVFGSDTQKKPNQGIAHLHFWK
jgi:hypothetical protein